MLDVVSLLGAGWKIDDSEVVKSTNQILLSSELPAVCELKKLATKLAGDGQQLYAPPLGWSVYWVSRDAGSSFEPMKLQDTIWLSSDGVAYSLNSCTKAVVDGGSETKTATAEKTNTWLILGILGISAYLAFKD